MSGLQSSTYTSPFTRWFLLKLLRDLQKRTWQEFGEKIRLFVHGGAVMILHPVISRLCFRQSTGDVDYIQRAFCHEWEKRGVYDAGDRLQKCIKGTADQYRIRPDWMNAAPDVALPLAWSSQGGYLYDPIYYDSRRENNVWFNTVYDSDALCLVSVTMAWGVALKLVRYKKQDPDDIAAMLLNGTILNGVQWTSETVRGWIWAQCWPMRYERYDTIRLARLDARIDDAVRRWECKVHSIPDVVDRLEYSERRTPYIVHPTHRYYPTGHGPYQQSWYTEPHYFTKCLPSSLPSTYLPHDLEPSFWPRSSSTSDLPVFPPSSPWDTSVDSW